MFCIALNDRSGAREDELVFAVAHMVLKPLMTLASTQIKSQTSLTTNLGRMVDVIIPLKIAEGIADTEIRDMLGTDIVMPALDAVLPVGDTSVIRSVYASRDPSQAALCAILLTHLLRLPFNRSSQVRHWCDSGNLWHTLHDSAEANPSTRSLNCSFHSTPSCGGKTAASLQKSMSDNLSTLCLDDQSSATSLQSTNQLLARSVSKNRLTLLSPVLRFAGLT